MMDSTDYDAFEPLDDPKYRPLTCILPGQRMDSTWALGVIINVRCIGELVEPVQPRQK